jgi:hypothetical protein
MPDRDRTLEVHCRNSGARFVAWYGAVEDADTQMIVQKCWLCGDDSFKRDVFKDSVIPLIAQRYGARREARLTGGTRR